MIIRHGRAVSQGKQGLFWGGGRWRAALSVTAAASVGRWATSHRGVAAPKGEARLGSPFGGAGAVRRLRGQGAGSQPSFRKATFSVRHRSGKAGPLAPVSLAFSHALRAYKVKGKVAPFLKKRRPKKLYACFPKAYRNFQISRSYSATERSEEKYPALAIFTSIFLAQAARSS